MLRPWTAAAAWSRRSRSSQNTRAALGPRPGGVPRRASALLTGPDAAEGPRRPRSPSTSPASPRDALGQLARITAPLVQVPPRGCWKQRWRGLRVRRPVGRRRPLVEPECRGDRPALPARVRPGLGRRRDGLVGDHPARRRCSPRWTTWSGTRTSTARCSTTCPGRRARRRGRARAGPAARRLRQRLALARRPRPGDRPESRKLWMASTAPAPTPSSPTAWLVGLWRVEDGRVEVLHTLRPLTKSERSELDEEIAGVERAAGPLAPAVASATAAPRRRRRRPVEVRSTSAPRRTAARPALGERRDLGVGEPALGSDHEDDLAALGHADVGERGGRLLVQDDARRRVAQQRRPRRRSTRARPPRGTRTGGPAWPTPGRSPASGPATSPPGRPSSAPTLRSAAHGTTVSTPISVSTATASSPRSPLGRPGRRRAGAPVGARTRPR